MLAARWRCPERDLLRGTWWRPPWRSACRCDGQLSSELVCRSGVGQVNRCRRVAIFRCEVLIESADHALVEVECFTTQRRQGHRSPKRLLACEIGDSKGGSTWQSTQLRRTQGRLDYVRHRGCLPTTPLKDGRRRTRAQGTLYDPERSVSGDNEQALMDSLAQQ